MFYASSDPNCAYREIGVTVGQMVVHASWVTTAPMLLHDLGYTAQVLDRAGARRELPDRHREFYSSGRLNETAKQVRDFLALSFTRPSDAKYALSAAIAEVHMRADDFAGLMYPAVSKAANVDNVALRAAFVCDALRLEAAQLVKVDTIADDGTIGGVILCDLREVAQDGALSWTFRERGSDVPPGGSVAVRVGDSLTVQNAGELLIEGRAYEVDAGFTIEVAEHGAIVRNLQGTQVFPRS